MVPLHAWQIAEFETFSISVHQNATPHGKTQLHGKPAMLNVTESIEIKLVEDLQTQHAKVER